MLKKLAIIASLPMFLVIARFVPFERLPSICVFYNVIGLPCPSCGMTRSVIALTHLNFALSVQMNPFGLIMVGIMGLWWVCSIYEIATGTRNRLLEWARRRGSLLALVGTVVFFTYGIGRIWMLIHRNG